MFLLLAHVDAACCLGVRWLNAAQCPQCTISSHWEDSTRVRGSAGKLFGKL